MLLRVLTIGRSKRDGLFANFPRLYVILTKWFSETLIGFWIHNSLGPGSSSSIRMLVRMRGTCTGNDGNNPGEHPQTLPERFDHVASEPSRLLPLSDMPASKLVVNDPAAGLTRMPVSHAIDLHLLLFVPFFFLFRGHLRTKDMEQATPSTKTHVSCSLRTELFFVEFGSIF